MVKGRALHGNRLSGSRVLGLSGDAGTGVPRSMAGCFDVAAEAFDSDKITLYLWWMSHEVSDFEIEVRQRSERVPVLVDFWAPWCAPCRGLAPVLERLASQAEGRWELAKVNTEEHPEIAATFNIASIPAVKLFVNREVVNEFIGALPEREIRRFLEKALPSPGAEAIAKAQDLLGKGENGAAAQLLEDVVASEPGNNQARVLLAQTLLASAPERIAPLLAPMGLDSDFGDKAAALRTLARLAEVRKAPAELPAGPVRERYLAGAAALRSGNFEAALAAFIEVLERDKQYAEGEAKEACKAAFLLLGTRHPLAERYFRRFSSALHSQRKARSLFRSETVAHETATGTVSQSPVLFRTEIAH
jgi:putative thioredoxin